MIAARYVGGSGAFQHWRPVACADLDADVAAAFARGTAFVRSVSAS